MYDVAAHHPTTPAPGHLLAFQVVTHNDVQRAITDLTAAHPAAEIVITPDHHDDDLLQCDTCPATCPEDQAADNGWVLDEARGEWHCEACADAGPTPGPYNRAYWG